MVDRPARVLQLRVPPVPGEVQVNVHLADLEPFASFLAEVFRAQAIFAGMTDADKRALPGPAARGALVLQQAADGFRGLIPGGADSPGGGG